jgi:glyoxylase-like metal-dependent hydrolase (beta-lactamase superfamily II)
MDQPIHPSISTVKIWWEDTKSHIPVYLVAGRSLALIDAGPPQRVPGRLAEALAPFNAKPKDIATVLLTHGHLDHVGGLPEIKAAGPVQVLIGKEDAFLLTDHSKAFDDFYAVGDRMLSGKEDLSEAKKGFLMGAGPEYIPDRLLADGDVIDLGAGVKLTAVHLPGHSMGSIGYYWEKDGVMICGDAIPALSGPGGSLPIIMDLFAYRRSIDRLMGIPLKTLVFTHAYRGMRLAPSTVRRGDEIKQYLADAKTVADRLIDVLKKASAARSGKPFLEVADQVIAAMPAEMGYVPLAKQFTPQFSVSTIFWGFSLLEGDK